MGRRVSKLDGSFLKTKTRFIGDVYRFPNMLVENKKILRLAGLMENTGTADEIRSSPYGTP